MKNLTDEEDSSFERIDEDSQLETSEESESDEEKEEETFEVVQDELAQARAEIDRLKKRLKELAGSTLVLMACGFIILVAMRLTPPAAPIVEPTCPDAPECPAPPACPHDSFASRHISFKLEQRENYMGFRLEETFVGSVDWKSNAVSAGLREGDEIVSINGKVTWPMSKDKLSETIRASKDTVNLTVRHNSDGLTKWRGLKYRATNQGKQEGFAEGKKKGIEEGYAQAASNYSLVGTAAMLFLVGWIALVRKIEEKEKTSAEKKKDTESPEETKNQPESEPELESESESAKEVVEEGKKEDKKELEIEEIIERACKVIRAELNVAKDKNDEPMKSSAHVDELMRGWLENTLDENLKRNDGLLNL